MQPTFLFSYINKGKTIFSSQHMHPYGKIFFLLVSFGLDYNENERVINVSDVHYFPNLVVP